MYQIIIQYADDKTLAPKASLLRKWAIRALSRKTASAEVTIRIVGLDEMTTLNTTYRQKKGPTNVLSFPFTLPDEVAMEIDVPMLGDIVICTDVVNREATEQEKSTDEHWAHMIVHGVFHLLGYDHELDSDAVIMESLEIEIMQELGFPDPYQRGDNINHYD